ncbi:CLUMA_CG005033, isoform A [Clunio marinus]|uniref:CLUMA_CG005033, isoform A n=1 Tax=Clunio marinus TaxID=568069 RepID=A0A1J1HTG2_9DIPT|nr:CLUMA_CG005033, isoform A [Clunio marinus]
METTLSSLMTTSVDELVNNSSMLDFMLNPSATPTTCSETSEDCVIDHSVVCVGEAIFCNLSREDYENLLYEYIAPTIPEWILIFSHIIVFLMGLIGNALVCLAVYTNHSMRTVTNIFIVNLAVADFFVILLCLPPTVVWDVTETWFLGEVLCKVVIYFQTVSVTVSILTLTFISIDRWYAICFPLRYKPQPGRAMVWIAIIWTVALLFDLPEFFVLHLAHRRLRFDIQLFTQCVASWSAEDEKLFNIIKAIFLYTLPLTLMTIAYFQIVRVLWRSDTIPGHSNIKVQKPSYYRNKVNHASHGESNATTMGQLRARRKASKMLVAVVIMFAACYFPVHALNIIRYTYTDIDQSEVVSVLSLLSHWLCYANSAINPLIYNFMSGKFRREFRNVLERGHCLTLKSHQRSNQWQSQYRSRYANEDQEHSFIHSTTHMIHITPSSLKRNYACPPQTCQTSFTNGGTSRENSSCLKGPSFTAKRN